MKEANDLRAQARELLQQAEALDGKKLWAISLGGSDLDAPMTLLYWGANRPSDAEACDATDTDKDSVDNGGIELAIRHLKLEELVPL